MIKEQVDTDLKQAMLAGDKQLVTTLRGVKSVILDAEIAKGLRAEGLEDSVTLALLQKEAKKRSDAAELYDKAGDGDRAAQERYEREVIERYLPEMMSESEIDAIVDSIITSMGGAVQKQQMGQIISEVKAKTEGRAEGSVIARLVQSKLS